MRKHNQPAAPILRVVRGDDRPRGDAAVTAAPAAFDLAELGRRVLQEAMRRTRERLARCDASAASTARRSDTDVTQPASAGKSGKSKPADVASAFTLRLVSKPCGRRS